MIEKYGTPNKDLNKLHEELISLYKLYYSKYDSLPAQEKYHLINNIRKMQLIYSRAINEEFNNQFN